MKTKFAIVTALLLIISALIILIPTRTFEKITVKVSKAVKDRKIVSLHCVNSIHLNHTAQEIVASQDAIRYIPYENDRALYYVRNISGEETAIEYPGLVSASTIQNCFGRIWCFSRKRHTLYEFTREDLLIDSFRVNELAWRGVVAGDVFLYNAHSTGVERFYLYDFHSRKHVDSFDASKAFGITEEPDLDLKLSGFFFSSDSCVYYQTIKGSESIVFNGRNLNDHHVAQTIDSLPFPKIIDKEIAPHVIQKVPEPELPVT